MKSGKVKVETECWWQDRQCVVLIEYVWGELNGCPVCRMLHGSVEYLREPDDN